MDQRVPVPTQAALLAIFAGLAVLTCGHDCGFALVVIVGLGAAGWAALALHYRLRAGGRREELRRRHDRRALASALLGFGVPLAAAIWAWQTPSFDGLLLHTGAAAFGAALVAVLFTAILTSSMIDWYLVMPFVLGLFGPPIWTDDETQGDRRRWYAQVWVFHRGTCELLVLTSVALLLAIGVVALGNAVSSDRTLPAAFESLGGAGIAFGVFGYLGTRLGPALDYVLSAPVGLGAWVTGTDQFGRDVSGMVVDVSVHPGLKVVGLPAGADECDHRAFVALRYVPLVEGGSRPSGVDDAWCERTVRRHLRRDPGKSTPLARRLLHRAGGAARSRSWIAFAALVSLLGLAVFAAAIVALHAIDAELSPARHTISEYVHADAGAAMSVGFASWAVSLVAAAVLVLLTRTLEARSRRLSAVLAALLATAAVAVVVLDAFPTQTVAGALPAGAAWTTAGRLHDVGSGVTTLALLGASLVSLWLLSEHRAYRRAVVGLLAIGLVGTIACLAIGASAGGARQRLLVAVAICWQALLVETLRRSSRAVFRSEREAARVVEAARCLDDLG